jgi:DNA mismatch endonuclease (patch repair protein)
MADVLTKEQRRRNMQRIRAKDTKPEVVLRKELWHKGFRYRKNWKELPGKPDIVLTKYKICIFIDSEFFHGKGFKSGYESNKYSSLEEQLRHSNHSEFWLEKIQKNMERDLKINAELTGNGWKVLRFWSRDVLKNTDQCITTIEETLFASEMEN